MGHALWLMLARLALRRGREKEWSVEISTGVGGLTATADRQRGPKPGRREAGNEEPGDSRGRSVAVRPLQEPDDGLGQ